MVMKIYQFHNMFLFRITCKHMVTSTRSKTVFKELQANVFMIEYKKAKCGMYTIIASIKFNASLICMILFLDASESLIVLLE